MHWSRHAPWEALQPWLPALTHSLTIHLPSASPPWTCLPWILLNTFPFPVRSTWVIWPFETCLIQALFQCAPDLLDTLAIQKLQARQASIRVKQHTSKLNWREGEMSGRYPIMNLNFRTSFVNHVATQSNLHLVRSKHSDSQTGPLPSDNTI